MARLFGVRMAGMTVTIMVMVLALAAPFIDLLVWLGGVRWLGAYAVAGGMAMASVAVAVGIVGVLFRLVGPRRTRAASQVLAALVGGAFAVAVQFAAMAGSGRAIMSRIEVTGLWLGDADSPWLWPARAATGEVGPLVAMLGASGGMLGLAILAMAPRFGRQVLAASEVTAAVPGPLRGPMRGRSRWRGASPAQALRRKEWTLLLRDPWLLSQTLMQLLYLLPVGYMLWLNFYRATGASAFLVPIMIVTAGQLGGGLAWLAVSAEDAPELIATAPVAGGTVLRAKTTAVLGGIGVIFGPFVLVLAALAPADGLAALGGVTAAAASATAIQYWFRTQVKRSLFRRRQTSSKVATIAEALSSTGWAATGALAAAPTWLALVPGALVLVILAGVWAISPGREARGI